MWPPPCADPPRERRKNPGTPRKPWTPDLDEMAAVELPGHCRHLTPLVDKALRNDQPANAAK